MIRLSVPNRTWRRVLIAAAAVVVLVLTLPYLVPLDAYRGRIEIAAEHATGRTLRIEGPLRLMMFPHFGLRAHDVTFANMPGGRARAMATAGEIRLTMCVLPLLTGRVVLDKIVLDRPAIVLEVNKQGAANWQFATAAPSPSVSGRQGDSSITLPSESEFSGIEIDDGRIAYDNAKTGTHHVVEHVNASVDITRLDRPVTAQGNVTIGTDRLDFIVHIATPKTLFGNGTTTVDLAINSALAQAGFKGMLAADGGIDGVFKLDATDLRTVAGWFGEELPAGGGLSALSLQCRLVSRDKISTLSPLRVSLDDQHMTGTLSLDRRGNIPVLDGVLTVDRLDLNPYLASGRKEPPASGKADPGWSKSRISLALLSKIDGRLTVNTGSLRLRGLRLGRTKLNVALAGGVLTARLDPITLYGGTGRAELDVDSRGAVPQFRNSLAFEGISLQPLLNDTLGLESIEGVGAIKLETAAQGTSAYAVMHSLSGKGSITGTNGRFRGVDLAQVARTIQQVFGGDATGGDASTPFHTMGGSFVIARGVLTNNDFRLSGPVVQMTGAGNIDIGNRTLDFRLVPQAAKIGVPFRVKGSWDHVHYAPDVGGMLGGVIQNLETGRAPFKGLFGGGGTQKDNSGKKKKSVGDTLKGMFGIH